MPVEFGPDREFDEAFDHIAIGPRGVFVIDAKHYNGGPTLRTSGGLFSPRVE